MNECVGVCSILDWKHKHKFITDNLHITGDETFMLSRSDSLVFTVKNSDLNSKASNHEKSCKHIKLETLPICTGY